MDVLLAIVILGLVISGIVALCRFVNRRFKEMVDAREDPRKTLESIAIDFDVCHFCGTQMTEKTVLRQKMFRLVNSQMTTPAQTLSLYEKLEVNIPCCEECSANNKKEDEKVDRWSMRMALLAALGVGVLVAWLFSSQWTDYPLAVIMAVISLAVLVGTIVHSVVQLIMKPEFKQKIKNHVAVAALSREGWSIGDPPGKRI